MVLLLMIRDRDKEEHEGLYIVRLTVHHTYRLLNATGHGILLEPISYPERRVTAISRTIQRTHRGATWRDLISRVGPENLRLTIGQSVSFWQCEIDS